MSITLDNLLYKFDNFKDNVKDIIKNKTTNVETAEHNFNNFIQGGSGNYLSNIFTDKYTNFITDLGYNDDSGYGTTDDVKKECQHRQSKKLDNVLSSPIFDSDNHDGTTEILNYSDLINIRYDKDNNLLYLKEADDKLYDLSIKLSSQSKIYKKHICLYLLLKYYYNNKLEDEDEIDITKYNKKSIFPISSIPDSEIDEYLKLFKNALKNTSGSQIKNLKNRNDYIVILYHYYNVFITLINYKIIYEFIITNCNIHHTIIGGSFKVEYINYCDWENLIINNEANKCENVDAPITDNCKVNFALYNADIMNTDLEDFLTGSTYNDIVLIDQFNNKYGISPFSDVLETDGSSSYKLKSSKNQLYESSSSIKSKFIENRKCKDFDKLYIETDDHQHNNFYSSLKRGLSRKLHEDFQENLNEMNLTKNKDKESNDYNSIKETIKNKEDKIKKTDKDIKENNKLLNSFNNKDKRLIYTYYITIIICFIILLSLIKINDNNMILSIIIFLLIIYYILISYLNNVNTKENFDEEPPEEDEEGTPAPVSQSPFKKVVDFIGGAGGSGGGASAPDSAPDSLAWKEHIDSKKEERTLYDELKEIRENNLSLINNIIDVTEFKIRHETSLNEIIDYTKYIKDKDNRYKNTLLLSLNNLYNLNDNLNSKGYDLKIKEININFMILLLLLIILILFLINLTKLNNIIMGFGIVIFIVIIGIYFYKIANIKEGDYRKKYWFSV